MAPLYNYLTQNEQLLFVNDPKFRFSFSEDNNNNNAKPVVSFEDTEQFLLQAVDRSADQQYIEQLACYHFQIQSFEQLGHGSFRSVYNSVKQNQKSKMTSLHYECIMFDEIALLKQTLNRASRSFLEGK